LTSIDASVPVKPVTGKLFEQRKLFVNKKM
jgi:hypothetical protein